MKRRSTQFFVIAGFLFVLLNAGGSLGQDAPICKDDIGQLSGSYTIAEYAVKRLANDDPCQLINNNPLIKNLIKKLDELGNPKIKAAETKHKSIADAFKALKAKTQDIEIPSSASNTAQNNFEKAKIELIDRIDTALMFIAAQESGLDTVNKIKGAPIYPGVWEIDTNDFTFNGYQSVKGDDIYATVMSVNDMLPELCRGNYTANCNNFVAPVHEFVTLYALGQRIANYYSRDELKVKYEQVKTRNKMWDKYFFEALPQYPYEMLINSWFNDDKRSKDIYGNELGPLEVPNRQIIFCHPSVGLEYVDNVDDSHQFEPVINFEVIGYNRWKWSKSGNMEWPLGISAVATLSGRGGSDAIGYGAMFHLNNTYSAGVTYRDDGDWGITVNLKLESFLRESFEKAKGYALKFGIDYPDR